MTIAILTLLCLFLLVIAAAAGAAAIYFFRKSGQLEKKYGAIIDVDAEVARRDSDSRTRWEAAQADSRRVVDEATASARRMVDEATASARSIVTEARTEFNRLNNEGRIESERAHQAAEQELAQARSAARTALETARSNADTIIRRANESGDLLVKNAQAEAQRIAGSALEALENANKYTEIAKAMKRVIEGYGDEYIVPTFTLLDELAEHFGYTEAGEAAKRAKALTKSLFDQGAAAECDYVEQNRRETAISFVLDAFNGKFESIISEVKHDNYGKLAQKLRDAFTLVNMNGAAFRNARITKKYLDARMEELRWLTVLNELKIREREEQRVIKERIREEERAQKEFERAIREAAKEEEALQKAMAKLQGQLERATEEQRVKFQAQLDELEEKLRLAEEKNQRAISMAQLTKSGHVYVISNIGSFGEDVYKIGLTRRLEPMERVKELGDASVPFEFDVHAIVYSEDAPALESSLHKQFVRNQVNKVNPKKEFFRVPLAEIRKQIDSMGIESSWTMVAAAAQYRETLAIEKQLAAKQIDEKLWINDQMEAHTVEMEAFQLEA